VYPSQEQALAAWGARSGVSLWLRAQVVVWACAQLITDCY